MVRAEMKVENFVLAGTFRPYIRGLKAAIAVLCRKTAVHPLSILIIDTALG